MEFLKLRKHQLVKDKYNPLIKGLTVVSQELARSPANLRSYFQALLMAPQSVEARTDTLLCLLFTQINAIRRGSPEILDGAHSLFSNLVYLFDTNRSHLVDCFLLIFENLGDWKAEFYAPFVVAFADHFDFLASNDRFSTLLFQVIRNLGFWVYHRHSTAPALALATLLAEKCAGVPGPAIQKLEPTLLFIAFKSLCFCLKYPHLGDVAAKLTEFVRQTAPDRTYLYKVAGREAYLWAQDDEVRTKLGMVLPALNVDELLNVTMIQSIHVQMLACALPLAIENYLLFLLKSARKTSYNYQFGWLLDLANIVQNSESEAAIVDIVRYVLVCTQDMYGPEDTTYTRRWLIVAWLFKILASPTVFQKAKCALLWEWAVPLVYEHEAEFEEKVRREYRQTYTDPIMVEMGVSTELRSFKVFKTGWELFVSTLKNFPDLSSDLFETAVLMSDKFSTNGMEMSKNLAIVRAENPAFYDQLAHFPAFPPSVSQKLAHLPTIFLAGKWEGSIEGSFHDYEQPDIFPDHRPPVFEGGEAGPRPVYSPHESFDDAGVSFPVPSEKDEGENGFGNPSGLLAQYTHNPHSEILSELEEVFGQIERRGAVEAADFYQRVIEINEELVARLVAALQTEVAIEKSASYCDQDFFIFKKQFLDGEELTLLQSIFRKMLRLFVQDLFAYSLFELFLAAVVDQLPRLGSQLLVFLYEFREGPSEQAASLNEILARVFAQVPKFSEIVEASFKWAFVRTNEADLSALLVFWGQFLRKLPDDKPAVCLARGILEIFDDKRWGLLIDPRHTPALLTWTLRYFVQVVSDGRDTETIYNALALLENCFFYKVPFEPLVYRTLFWKIGESRLSSESLLKHKCQRLVHLVQSSYEEKEKIDFLAAILQLPFEGRRETVSFLVSGIDPRVVLKLVRSRLVLEKANRDYIVNLLGEIIRAPQQLGRAGNPWGLFGGGERPGHPAGQERQVGHQLQPAGG